MADTRWTTEALSLQPGDWVLSLTDGMLERNAELLDLSGHRGQRDRRPVQRTGRRAAAAVTD